MKRLRRKAVAPSAPPAAAAKPAPEPQSEVLPGLAALLPEGERDAAYRNWLLNRLRTTVHPQFYLAQLRQVDPPQVDALGPDPAIDEVLEHYVARGARMGLRPGALFHPSTYAERAATAGLDIGDTVPFLHWAVVGWREEIVPTPLFDPVSYVEENPGPARYDGWVFRHYLNVGCRKRRLVPSPYGIHHQQYNIEDPRAANDPLFLPELLIGSDDFDLRETSWLEEGVLRAARQNDRLTTSPALRGAIERAAIAEPLIGAPYRHRRPVMSALNANPRRRIGVEVDAAVAEVRATDDAPVDTMILVPHVRVGGGARVSGLFAHAVQAVAPGERVLVVSTELPAFERLDWFPSDVPVYDLSARMEGMRDEAREDVLLGLITELAPRRVVNINSRIGWRVMCEHGAQVAAMTTMGAYLFTWELNEWGYRGGYPIRAFQAAFSHLHWTLFDSVALRDELVARFALPAVSAERLVVARTPVDPPGIDVAGVFEKRRAEGLPLRAFWAGRFAQQKRFDLVVEIARLMPELEIWAWGKVILGGESAVDLTDLPDNIRLMGTYTDFDTLPLHELDFMLYTSQWDGIPTLVLDGAQAGLPVVASSVGGLPEVINAETGYLVEEPLNPAAYVAAIGKLLADPAAAGRKVAAVRELIARDFSLEDYQRIVAEAVTGRRSSR